MVFRTKTDGFIWTISAIVFFIYACVGLLIFYSEKEPDAFFGLGTIWLLLSIFIIWVLPKSTKYTFLDDHLLCQSSGFKKRIPYSSFRKIEPANGLYAGWKMSTAWKCLVVHYNKYDELLISPENEAEFIRMFYEKKAQFTSVN
jgi:hypothetical protein